MNSVIATIIRRRSRVNPIPGKKWCSFHKLFHPATQEYFYRGRPGQLNSPCKEGKRNAQPRYDSNRGKKHLMHRGFSTEAALALSNALCVAGSRQ